MATRSVATVFGGAGFLGRYVVKRLARAGYVVRVAGRDPEAAMVLKPMGAVGQIVPLFAPLQHEAAVARAVADAELVVNLVGLLAERRRGDFLRVHEEGAGRVARLAAAAGTRALVHVSAIGADPASDALYARTKAGGEAAVRGAFPAAALLRPSVIFGPEDRFLNRFAALASWSPVLPLIHGRSRLQPVYVGDVADAVMAALTRPDAAGAVFELGGPEIVTFEALLRWMLKTIHRRRKLLPIPPPLAAMQAALCEWLPGKPLTRDQVRLLAHDNVCNPALPGLPALGVVPTPLEMIAPGYLIRFQPGGGRLKLPEPEDRYETGPISAGTI
jgi:NADH dehydrogenase